MKYANPIFMPQLGQTAEESTLVRWLKKEGDNVKIGDILFELETDKAVLESESFHNGTLLKIVVNENEQVPVKTVVGFVGDKGDKFPDITGESNFGIVTAAHELSPRRNVELEAVPVADSCATPIASSAIFARVIWLSAMWAVSIAPAAISSLSTASSARWALSIEAST